LPRKKGCKATNHVIFGFLFHCGNLDPKMAKKMQKSVKIPREKVCTKLKNPKFVSSSAKTAKIGAEEVIIY
jgi:hypothetical protein